MFSIVKFLIANTYDLDVFLTIIYFDDLYSIRELKHL